MAVTLGIPSLLLGLPRRQLHKAQNRLGILVGHQQEAPILQPRDAFPVARGFGVYQFELDDPAGRTREGGATLAAGELDDALDLVEAGVGWPLAMRHEQLIRLRLEAVRKLPDGVAAITLAAESLPANEDQLRLFEGRKRRDHAAADRALARLRAELGDAAVVRARLRDAHLPEARFVWEQIAHVLSAKPGEAGGNVLVRRLFGKPVPLSSRSRNEPDGWMLRGLQHGPVIRTQGPHVVSGGWWNRPVHREYHFAETQKGELLWIFYDRVRRKWFMHGRVE